VNPLVSTTGLSACAPAVAPLLVLAVGNPSRGDDALGPMLVERLRATDIERDGEVELMTDFQLQVEHALDLDGRRAVLFVDAALPGAGGAEGLPEAGGGARIETAEADDRVPPASHALRPQAVLHVARRVCAAVPPAWLLAIEGVSFELGDGLSDVAERRLDEATRLALAWLRAQQARTGEADACTS
jgi:hydrogenase maturation protease